ncbi:hypothetical protein CspeluHIS016_0302120 [Cutaneotrichosporon spelunceum]|uniref:Uncharacterized protein n=1 Tax=Cutaneotrichosporon spelunceum TaxID=1672016 RepID=A0AAD3TT13_9TREE|nr:hypothetical protein CspeluHIS016_0302120 [Cutaneotrichosporon spelunceum]
MVAQALLLAAFAALAHTDLTAPISLTIEEVSSSWKTSGDTPASSYLDKDGTYYFQQSHALYGATDGRQWNYYAGTSMDDAKHLPISNATNPTEPRGSNRDTTWRCNNPPTGKKATQAVTSITTLHVHSTVVEKYQN